MYQIDILDLTNSHLYSRSVLQIVNYCTSGTIANRIIVILFFNFSEEIKEKNANIHERFHIILKVYQQWTKHNLWKLINCECPLSIINRAATVSNLLFWHTWRQKLKISISVLQLRLYISKRNKYIFYAALHEIKHQCLHHFNFLH